MYSFHHRHNKDGNIFLLILYFPSDIYFRHIQTTLIFVREYGKPFFLTKTNFQGSHKNSGISKLSKYHAVGTLNLCQEMPEPMQKESAQSDPFVRPLKIIFLLEKKVSRYSHIYRSPHQILAKRIRRPQGGFVHPRVLSLGYLANSPSNLIKMNCNLATKTSNIVALQS